jgi:hypothetical protein
MGSHNNDADGKTLMRPPALLMAKKSLRSWLFEQYCRRNVRRVDYGEFSLPEGGKTIF